MTLLRATYYDRRMPVENPENAEICDCGYAFASGTGGVRPSLWKRSRAIRLVMGYLLVLLVGFALLFLLFFRPAVL